MGERSEKVKSMLTNEVIAAYERRARELGVSEENARVARDLTVAYSQIDWDQNPYEEIEVSEEVLLAFLEFLWTDTIKQNKNRDMEAGEMPPKVAYLYGFCVGMATMKNYERRPRGGVEEA